MNEPKYLAGKINETNYQAMVLSYPTVNIIFARTENSFLGCGVFDVNAFQRLGIPAAKVTGISTVDELFNKKIAECNELALLSGVEPNMTGGSALLKMEGDESGA
ncbi:MAG: DUF1805 domain-containing protein [Methanocorpusculum sp.]|nr:DUF1805 domain-containing protein [Methanocorpusculum sp.]